MELEHNDFTRLFERYGWTVEQLGDNSYIADNGTYFVAFSVYGGGCNMPVAMATSYLSVDKDEFVKQWKSHNEGVYHATIGNFAYSGRHNFTHSGNVNNHDHSTWEIESWLRYLARQK